MPLVEGESLRARLDRERQLPVAEAIRIAVAVASALDYAHRHGVIHRDLKPDNILLHDGEPLVADFGIALAVSRAGGARVTQTGIALGTPQYMSPEQAAADRVIDGRSDIYALGAMLYEMLTGDPPHTGSTMQAVIARVLTEQPRSARATRASIPEHVSDAIDRALAKMPADRFDTAQQFAQALEAGNVSVSSGQHRPGGGTARSRRWTPVFLAAGALALVVGTAAAMWLWARSRSVADTRVVRVLMKALPDAVEPASITPDGKNLLYVGMSQGKRMVFVRPVDGFRATPIAGTEGALRPFSSPDGGQVGFFTTDDKLRRVALEGGTPSVLSPAFRLGNASWAGPNGGVVVTDFNQLGVLTWVRASGGTMKPLTALNTAKAETAHFAPLVLPDGRSVIFNVQYETHGTELRVGQFAFVSIDDASNAAARHVELGIRGRRAVGFVDGWLFYIGEDPTVLMAARLDITSRRIDGAPVVALQDPSGVQGVHLSQSGTLVYSHQSSSENEAMIVDAAGTAKPLPAMSHGPYMNPRLSPDGQRLAIQGTSPEGSDLWIHDLQTGTATRLTNSGSAISPAWSSDGKRVIWSTELEGGHAFKAVVKERFDNYMPALSPDGRWLAYVSTSSGKHEIYVQPYPGPGTPVQVSQDGGTEPAWARDGRSLFYRNGNQLLAATINTSSSFAVTEPRLLFRHTFDGEMPHTNFVPTADGRFIMISAGAEPDMVIVVNWLAEFRARIRERAARQ